MNINKIIENFYFLKVLDKNKNDFTFKYDNVFIGDNNNETYTFSQIFQIRFDLMSKQYDIYINDNKIMSKNVNIIDFSSISEIFILNNFLGEVSSIIINSKYIIVDEDRRKNYNLKIDVYNENIKNNLNVDINLLMNGKKVEEELKEHIVKWSGIIFNEQPFYYNNFNAWRKESKL